MALHILVARAAWAIGDDNRCFDRFLGLDDFSRRILFLIFFIVCTFSTIIFTFLIVLLTMRARHHDVFVIRTYATSL